MKITSPDGTETKLFEDGRVKSNVNRLVTAGYSCRCGASYKVSFEYPDKLQKVQNGGIDLSPAKCPICGNTIIFPPGVYVLNGHHLEWQPLPQTH
jgi:hypothetical protein